MIFRVTDLEAQIAAGSSLVAVWRWPRGGVLRGIALDDSLGDPTRRAGLSLSLYRRQRFHVVDEQGKQFLNASIGSGPAQEALDVDPVVVGFDDLEEWTLEVKNEGTNAATPRLFFMATTRGEEP